MQMINENLDHIDLDWIIQDLEELKIFEEDEETDWERMPTELDLKEWEWRGDW